MATSIKIELKWEKPYCHIDVVPDSDKASIDYTDDKSEGSDDLGLRKGLRTAVCVTVRYKYFNYHICNVHLPSGRPAFARKVGYSYLEFLSNGI